MEFTNKKNHRLYRSRHRVSASSALGDSPLYQGRRHQLVQVLKSKGIHSEAVLRAIGSVPRHCFFDSALASHAYEDKAFPIEEGQTISQPYTVAFQTQLLALKPTDKVLEIGTGSGYQTCILLELTPYVYTVEYMSALHDKARQMLQSMGYSAQFFLGDGGLGLPLFAPYDAILATCASETIPQTWKDQLRVSGRIVAPIGDKKSQQMIVLRKKTADTFVKESFHRFNFVPLQGKYGYK